MILTLTTGTEYDLSDADDHRRLRQYIPTLRRRKRQSELDTICRQIEEAACIGYAELDIYNKAKQQNNIQPNEFLMQYYEPTFQENGTISKFTFIHGKLYRLPDSENEQTIQYTLLDKYIYERQRHARDSEVCLQLRRAIDKFIPGAINQSDAALKQILTTQETAAKTYYGEYPSDDSDSEDEAVFQKLSDENKKRINTQARKHRARIKSGTYQAAMDGSSSPPQIDYKTRPVIQRPTTFDRRATKADLERINEELEKTGTLTEDFLKSLKTKFVVAQYRGIHYVTSGWDAKARRQHRKMDECGQPQYSSAVLKAAGVTSYHDYLNKIESDPKFSTELGKKAVEVMTLLLYMQHSNPVSWDGSVYASLFHLLQYWYSANYDALPGRLEADAKKTNPDMKPYLVNSQRPLLSTADIPYHALKYAYGIKLYEGHEHERLDPHWRKGGRAERPYSGKVYVSLHTLTDYTKLNPSHVTSMFKQGLLKLNTLISPERETSFLGSIPKDRVVYQHVAKYPSFKGPYKAIYESKYGIHKEMYEKLKQKFNDFAPHSNERRLLKSVLGEYLCAYQEVRLIELAEQQAADKGEVLIYRDEDGKFSLYHPDTPHIANDRLKKIVMAKRDLYKSLAPNKSTHITKLSEAQLELRLKNLLPKPEQKQQRAYESMRLFGAKRPIHKCDLEERRPITPIRTFTQ